MSTLWILMGTATTPARMAGSRHTQRIHVPPASLPTLGFIGLGNMGGGMVKSLLRAGHPVLAFDVKTQLVQTALTKC